MLAKHFALLGATGVGKSSGVALILREVLRVRPAQRIFLLDPHNEYAPSFADRGRVITPAGLRLPYWLFNFEEFVDAVFRARPGVEDEVAILGQAIVAAKNKHASERDAMRSSLRRAGSSDYGFTVDTPVPYRFTDLMKIIDDEMGQLEKRSDVSDLPAPADTIAQSLDGPALRIHVPGCDSGRRHHGGDPWTICSISPMLRVR